MTTEEKAKRYDEALERARELATDLPNGRNDRLYYVWDLENIFPELCESEDEKIRKDLVNIVEWLKYNPKTLGRYYGDKYDKILAWLEKQDNEPKWCHHEVDFSECSEEYRKAYYDGWNNCNMQHSQCKSELDDVIKCLINGMKLYYEDNEEATWGTDKWYMPVKHIIEVLEKQLFKHLEKQGESKPTDKVEPKFKVGDWILFIASESAYQVEKIENYEYTLRYILGDSLCLPFSNEELIREWTIQDAKDGDVLVCNDNPFLFSKYEKDEYGFVCCSYCGISGNKEFVVNANAKKYWCDIEFVNPATKEQRDLLFQKMKEAGYEWDAEKKKLKKIEDKPAWDEEDEKMVKDIIAAIDTLYYHGMVNWLKSLKDRVQPQKQWKPSDEQINALEEAMYQVGILTPLGSKINDLCEQLKKLKEE